MRWATAWRNWSGSPTSARWRSSSAALSTALEASRGAPRDHAELASLASLVLRLAGRTRPAAESVGVGLLDAWLRLAEELSESPSPPWLTATWIDLLPGDPPDLDSPAELTRYEDWLILAHAVKATRPQWLLRLGFPGDQPGIAVQLAAAVRPLIDSEPHSPRAARVSRLLMEVADLLGLDSVLSNRTLAVNRELTAAEAIDRAHIRRRHTSASRADRELVDRVLEELRKR